MTVLRCQILPVCDPGMTRKHIANADMGLSTGCRIPLAFFEVRRAAGSIKAEGVPPVADAAGPGGFDDSGNIGGSGGNSGGGSGGRSDGGAGEGASDDGDEELLHLEEVHKTSDLC